MRTVFKLIMLVGIGLHLQGCAIVMSSTLPVKRDPAWLVPGMSQARIDRTYGAPIAAGMCHDNLEYIEQIQFVNGTSIGWKIVRIHIHSILDVCTCFLWEFPGTIIECAYRDYPEYTYFLVYDENLKLLRAVPQNSPEGTEISLLPWVSPKIDLWEECDGVNRVPTSDRLHSFGE